MQSLNIFPFGFSLFIFGILAMNVYSETPVPIPSLASQPVLSPPPPLLPPPPPTPTPTEDECVEVLYQQEAAATCDDCPERCDLFCEGWGDFNGISLGCTTSPTFVTCKCCCQ
ncbi:hypothetical protein C5167_001788 [Papaver somniferum]|uniref:Uncharacterized protein n=1 Tax=Papaver somniferum TaxID=3469 RepID=A0A4Y7KT25_PAPSO|nr:hypothetical protein C5167_001788 [Papaver somniferum]